MKSVTEILKEIRPEFDFTASDDFIADGMLDSFDIVTLVSALDKNYGISIPGTDIVPENFQNLRDHRSAAAQERRRSMNFTFRRKRISGILVVVPANERSFVEEMRNFNFSRSAFSQAQGSDGLRQTPRCRTGSLCVRPGGVRAATPV